MCVFVFVCSLCLYLFALCVCVCLLSVFAVCVFVFTLIAHLFLLSLCSISLIYLSHLRIAGMNPAEKDVRAALAQMDTLRAQRDELETELNKTEVHMSLYINISIFMCTCPYGEGGHVYRTVCRPPCTFCVHVYITIVLI